MELPIELRQAIERLADGTKLSHQRQLSDEMTRAYMEERGDGSRLVTAEQSAVVYSIVRMPATYSAVCAAIEHTLELLPDGLESDSVLDIGAGTGACAWAVSRYCTPSSISCVEREAAMIAVGKRLMAGYEPLSAVRWIQSDALRYDGDSRYDLVIASYALNEMTEEGRDKLLAKLWGMTAKLLLIVEPGTVSAFRMQQDIRRRMSALGANVIAPCPVGSRCALPDNDWCHFAVRVSRSRLHKAVKGVDSPFEDEKYTYTAFYRGDDYRHCRERVIRRPMIMPKEIGMRTCVSGEIVDRRVRKGDSLYKAAKKAKAGDAIVID